MGQVTLPMGENGPQICTSAPVVIGSNWYLPEEVRGKKVIHAVFPFTDVGYDGYPSFRTLWKGADGNWYVREKVNGTVNVEVDELTGKIPNTYPRGVPADMYIPYQILVYE